MEYRSLRPADCRAVALSGEVTEWPKVYDWKSYVPQKGTAGSNPALSASCKSTRDPAALAPDFLI